MNYQAAMFYLTLIMTLVNICVGLSVWWTNRDKVTNNRFKALEEEMITVKANIKTMPVCSNHERMEGMDKALLAKLEKIDRGVSTIAGRMEGINRMVDLLTQNELAGGKK